MKLEIIEECVDVVELVDSPLVDVIEFVERGARGAKGDRGFGASLQGSFYLRVCTDIEIPLIAHALFPFSIDALYNLVVISGEIKLSIKKNGVAIPGLSALTITTSPLNPTATSLNEVEIGEEVTILLYDNANAEGLKFTMGGTVLT